MTEVFYLYNNLDLFLTIALRISGYIVISPIFGRKEVSSFFKIGLVIYFSYIIILSNNYSIHEIPVTYIHFIIVCIIEVSKGLLMGLMSSLFFSAFFTAGSFIDTQIGFKMGGVLDPKYGTNTTLSGNLLNILALCIFLILDGHLQVLKILSYSYLYSPVGNADFLINVYSLFTSAFSLTFLAAFKIALPIILIIFFTDVILVVMIKYMPQLNIFVIGIPIKLITGLFAMNYIVSPLVSFLDPHFNNLFENLWKVLS
jgi:flagellar biosynthetic protein FliR